MSDPFLFRDRSSCTRLVLSCRGEMQSVVVVVQAVRALLLAMVFLMTLWVCLCQVRTGWGA